MLHLVEIIRNVRLAENGYDLVVAGVVKGASLVGPHIGDWSDVGMHGGIVHEDWLVCKRKTGKIAEDYGLAEWPARARTPSRFPFLCGSIIVVLVPLFPFVILAALVRLAPPIVITVLAAERNPRSEDAHIRFCRSVVVGDVLGLALGTNRMADAFHGWIVH